MFLQQAGSFWGGCLALWLALQAIEGKDAGLPPSEEDRDVKGELSNADEWVVDSDLPTECGPRKLTKRSSLSGVSWLRDVGSREANCQIFSVTTARPWITPTKDPRKATTRRIKAASPEEEPRLLYVMPFYPHRQHALYSVLFPINRGVSGYNAAWYYKSLGEDSSEEKRRKRDTASLEG